MTEPEDFMSRWARRKREAKAESADRPKRDDNAAQDSSAHEASLRPQSHPQEADAKSEPTLDLSKLPSLESIGPATDMRLFLQPGVPEALSRAALRRAWSADPGIRDFIGLSENSWDFTAADGMRGFGPLDPAEAKRLLAQLLGGAGDEEESIAAEQVLPGPAEQALTNASEADIAGAGAIEETPGEPLAAEGNSMLQSSNSDTGSAAPQQNEAEPSLAVPLPRRGHGGALPR